MYANYHTHTYRCNHAYGNEEDYIKRAIDCGIEIMGFADHAPFTLSDGKESYWRVSKKDVKDYFSTLNALREKYKDKIKIYIGFEMEYFPKQFDEMFKYVKSVGAEYLILGEHYTSPENEGGVHAMLGEHSEEELIKYTDCVIEGMKTGVFLYVAHPDVFLFSGDKGIYIREARRLCNASKELDVPLEINLLGINDNRHYPNNDFLRVAGEVGCKMIFGFDAHTVKRAFDDKSLVKANELVKKYNLNLIDEVEIIGL